MKFQDLKISQRFRFIEDLKIYRKVSACFASRNLELSHVYPEQEVKLVSEHEVEDYERIERESLWQQRLEKS